VKKGVLTVRDNEHSMVDTVGGDEVARRRLPRGTCAGRTLRSRGQAQEQLPLIAGELAIPGYCWILHCSGMPVN
jgi:hypothetical protein